LESYYKTQAAAERKIREWERETEDHGSVATDSRLRVAEWLNTWVNKHKATRLRLKTWRQYESIIRVHLAPAFGGLRLAHVTTHAFQAFLDEQELKKSPDTVRYMRTVMSAAYEHAVDMHLLTHNPIRRTKVPAGASSTKQTKNVYTSSEAIDVVAAVAHHRLAPLFLTLMFTGAREGEVLALRWSDFGDIGDCQFTITKTLHKHDRQWYFDEPKTEESERTQSFPAFLLPALKEMRTRQSKEKLASGPTWGAKILDSKSPISKGEELMVRDLVFTATHKGQPFDSSNVIKAWYFLLDLHGIKRIPIRNLRHTDGQIAKNLGADIYDIQQNHGHKDISTTQKHYLGSDSKASRRVADKMDSALGDQIREALASSL
jgi:integrase